MPKSRLPRKPLEHHVQTRLERFQPRKGQRARVQWPSNANPTVKRMMMTHRLPPQVYPVIKTHAEALAGGKDPKAVLHELYGTEKSRLVAERLFRAALDSSILMKKRAGQTG